MLTEQRILKQVSILADIGFMNVQWANQVSRDGEIIAETFERKAYGPEQKEEFLAEVEGGKAYAIAAGWISP